MDKKSLEIKFSKGILYYLPSGSDDAKIDSNSLWMLEFALGQVRWHVSKNSSNTTNTLSSLQKGPFLMISIHENPYVEWQIEKIKEEGNLTVGMIHAILSLLNSVFEEATEAKLHVEVYLNLLIVLLQGTAGPKSSFTFRELQVVHQVVFAIKSGMPGSILTAGRQIRNHPIQPHRFQRACREMFDSSLQAIIQHQKMKSAFDEIVMKNKNPVLVARSLGFVHYGNFSTGFRVYFGLTPTAAASFDRGASRLS